MSRRSTFRGVFPQVFLSAAISTGHPGVRSVSPAPPSTMHRPPLPMFPVSTQHPSSVKIHHLSVSSRPKPFNSATQYQHKQPESPSTSLNSINHHVHRNPIPRQQPRFNLPQVRLQHYRRLQDVQLMRKYLPSLDSRIYYLGTITYPTGFWKRLAV